MLKWILANPLKSIGAVLFGVPVIDFVLKRKDAKYLNAPVLKKLASGTKPRITQDGRVMIPRREIAKDLVNMCLPQSNNDSSKFLRFGVVIGPSGSGKTTAITEMCNRHPKGVLYYEIGEPKNFVNGLSKSIGLKTLLDWVYLSIIQVLLFIAT